jgi:hypothetical protein
MNRQQRRAQARGRVTPKKDKAPVLFADVTDETGKVKRIRLRGEEVSPEEYERAQRERRELEERRLRFEAHVHGLWLPGDEL